jgi:hypothetical protein
VSEDEKDIDSVESLSLILLFIKKIVDVLRFGGPYFRLIAAAFERPDCSLISESV